MGIDSFKFPCKKGIVCPAASHRTNTLQIVIILYYSHETVHSALHGSFIDHSGMVNAIMGQGRFIVAYHDRNRPPPCNCQVRHFPRKIAGDLAVLLDTQKFPVTLCLRFRLRLRNLNHLCLFRLFNAGRNRHFLIPGAACTQTESGCQRQYNPPFHHLAKPPVLRISSCLFSMAIRSCSSI